LIQWDLEPLGRGARRDFTNLIENIITFIYFREKKNVELNNNKNGFTHENLLAYVCRSHMNEGNSPHIRHDHFFTHFCSVDFQTR